MDDQVRVRLDLIERTRLNTLSCIFCGNTPTTKEHIFPEWSHEYLGPREATNAKMLVSAQHKDRTDFVFDLRMSGPLRDWQIKCVCGGLRKSCNNGWMRELENEVRPIMKPLILGDRTRLSPVHQKVIATWAVLKAILSHHPFIKRKKRKIFASTRVPQAEWSVWIGHYEHSERSARFVSRPFVLGPVGTEGRPAVPNCHASTQILNKLLVHVVNCVRPDFPYRWDFSRRGGRPLDGAILRIWPPTGQTIDWPLGPLSAPDVDVITDSLYRAIQRELASLK